MRRPFLLSLCLLLPILTWAAGSTDLVSQATDKKAHGDLKGALVDYTQAIAQDPKNAKAYIGRATVLALQGNYSAALADDTKAITLDPKNPVAYTNRGNVKIDLGNLTGAIADYTQAIALDPHHVHAFINRGNVWNLQKKYDKAIADYTAAIALDPRNAVAYYNRGGAQKMVWDYTDALNDFSKAIELNPNDAEAYINRATIEMARQNWSAATADLNKCTSILPADRQAYPRIYLWVIAAKQGEVKKATLDLAQAVSTLPKPAIEIWGWQIARYLAGDIDETYFLATASSIQAKKTADQKKSQAYYYIGLKHELAGDKAGAAKFFRKCLSLGNPTLHEYVLAQTELKNSTP